MSGVRFTFEGGNIRDFEIDPRELSANLPRPTRLNLRRTNLESPGGELNEPGWLEYDDVDTALTALALLDLADVSHIEVVGFVTRDANDTINGVHSRTVDLHPGFAPVTSVAVV